MVIYSLGFLFCLGLLFYFIAKYKESEMPDEDFLWSGKDGDFEKLPKVEDNKEESQTEQSPAQDFLKEVKEEAAAVQQVQRLFAKTDSLPVREIFDLKNKVKDFSYNLEENRLLEEKHYNELKTLAQNLEKRLVAFENEYLNNLHPTLTTLIQELENLEGKTKED